MPNGSLFDVDRAALIAHSGGFDFYMKIDENTIDFYSKKKLLKNLIDWEKHLLIKEYDVNPREQQWFISDKELRLKAEL